jgi:hypothetical protein
VSEIIIKHACGHEVGYAMRRKDLPEDADELLACHLCRALDAQVGRVLGWHEGEAEGEWVAAERPGHGFSSVWPGPPRFSSDIRHGWEVAEWLDRHGHDVSVTAMGAPLEAERRCWGVIINHEEPLFAPTAAEALCRALVARER